MAVLPALNRSAAHAVEQRRFMAAIAGGLLAALLAGEAQQAGRGYRVAASSRTPGPEEARVPYAVAAASRFLNGGTVCAGTDAASGA